MNTVNEALTRIEITHLTGTIYIHSPEIAFMYYTAKDDIWRGLQCNFENNSEEYNLLMEKLDKIAENYLKVLRD
jgi:hypothetical protein